MKNLTLAILFVVAMAFSACAPASKERTTFNTVQTLDSGLNTALDVWEASWIKRERAATTIAQLQPLLDERSKVKALLAKYRAAESAGINTWLIVKRTAPSSTTLSVESFVALIPEVQSIAAEIKTVIQGK